MRKLLYTLFISFLPAVMMAQTPVACCPDFELKQDYTPPCRGNCKQEGSPNPTGGGGVATPMMVSCRSTHNYMVVPNLSPAYTYTWTITGGSPATATGNPVSITWGAGTNAQIQVVITGPSGECIKKITKSICLVDGPIASFTATPNPVCAGTPVLFTNTTTGTISSFSWNFGDGTSQTGTTPTVTHTYSPSGTPAVYYAVLTVKGDTTQGGCACVSTDTVKITVTSGTGVQILPVSCKKMFCPGDTATFCAVGCTGPFNWTVIGGTPATATGNCIKVTWNASGPVPASVSVSAASCPGGCSNTATMQVPVLFPTLPISGNSIVCPGSNTGYSLPAMPGTFYKWTLSSGGIISGPDSNTNTITINWNNIPAGGGPFTITCNYHNPLTGCKGTATMQVYIKPPFVIGGVSSSCTGYPFNYSNISTTPGNANWTISPLGGYTVSSLSNVPFISGTWNLPNTYTVSAIPVTTTDYCSYPSTIVVTVNPVPVLNAITGNNTICKGSTHIYGITSNTTGGMFNWNITGAASYVLMGTHNDSVQVTWDNSGTYAISVSQTVKGCTSSAQNLTVNVVGNPAIAPNPGPFCIDGSTTFTASPVLPPGNYTWSINNPLGSLASPQGSNTMNVQWNGGITPGSAPATVTVTNQCGSGASITVNVITPNAFAVTQSGDLCNPTGVLMTATPGFSGYTWTGPLVGTTSANTAQALAPGFYTVNAQNANGCPVHASIYIAPRNLPPVTISANGSPVLYCTGTPIAINFTASFSSTYTGCSYQWLQNGLPMAGQITPSLNVVNATLQNNPGANTFQVQVTCGGCVVLSNAITVSVTACPSTSGCPFASTQRKSMSHIGGTTEERAAVSGLGSVVINSPSSNSILCNSSSTFTSAYSLAQPGFSLSQVYWDFGDGTTATGTQTGSGTGPYTNTVTHSYTTCGTYMVIMHVWVQCSPGVFCHMSDTIKVTVPAVARFTPSVHCDTVYLQDLSSICQPSCNFTYQWSATGPGTVSFLPAASGLYAGIANPTKMAVSASGVYNITLTLNSPSCGCMVSYSTSVTINLPNTNFTPPATVCAGTTVVFNAPGGSTYYNWNFGDGYQSNLNPATHTFAAPPPGSSNVTLTVTDANGCKAGKTLPVGILPPLTVAVTGHKDICPGESVTLSASPGTYQTYQWYYNGNPVSPGGTSPTYTTSLPGEYWVAVTSNSGGCKATSPHVIIKRKTAPVANIQPVTLICLSGGPGSVSISNSVQQPNVTYNWVMLSGPAAISFSPNNSNPAYSTVAAFTTPGDYVIELTATNNISGCSSKDTVCVKAYKSPVFTATGTTIGCSGTNYTFTASPASPYLYLWNNGATGTTMTTSIAGNYSVTAIDPVSGCSATKFAGTINPSPDVSLFPLSQCDTLCDTVKLVPPLALISSFQTYGIYTIKWYDGPALVHTGPFLNLGTLTPNPGQHNIHIVVTNAFNCSSTSGNYNVYVRPCGDCCKGSYWKDGPYWLNETTGFKEKIDCIKGGSKTFVITGKDCKNKFSVGGTFICAGKCPPKVVYTLYDINTNAVITAGTNSLSIPANLPNSGYYVTIQAYCGDVICSECRFIIKKDCPEKPCDCGGRKWETISISAGNPAPKDEKAIIAAPVNTRLSCGKSYPVKCNQPYTINAAFTCQGGDCSGSVQYKLTHPDNTVTTGTVPFSFTPNQNGVYTLVLYGYCGTTLCDSCVITFKAEGCTQPPCCPYEIKVNNPQVQTGTLSGPPATIVNTGFVFSGPAGSLFTEVRAEVVSYTLMDNFNNECLSCRSYPYTWASIYQPGNIGIITPQIGLFNATTGSFSPSGSGMYQNPREVVWVANAPFALPPLINMSFLLPPGSVLPCCELKAKICVKFTLRDKDCKECEVISCFEAVLPKK